MSTYMMREAICTLGTSWENQHVIHLRAKVGKIIPAALKWSYNPRSTDSSNGMNMWAIAVSAMRRSDLMESRKCPSANLFKTMLVSDGDSRLMMSRADVRKPKIMVTIVSKVGLGAASVRKTAVMTLKRIFCLEALRQRTTRLLRVGFLSQTECPD
jgi:hypothetical protein